MPTALASAADGSMPGDAPPPFGPLLSVFEDDPAMVGLLYEGDGQIALDRAQHYAGVVSLRVTANQRYRTRMPGWGVRVRENPGEGEFRFLRFAWRKRGGNNVMLQLAAGGKFGPLRGEPGPALRYEAGEDNRFVGAAIKISKELPKEWQVVTRDLFADFGEFELTGLAFTPGAGEYGLLDHVYLARSESDLAQCPAPQPTPLGPEARRGRRP